MVTSCATVGAAGFCAPLWAIQEMNYSIQNNSLSRSFVVSQPLFESTGSAPSIDRYFFNANSAKLIRSRLRVVPLQPWVRRRQWAAIIILFLISKGGAVSAMLASSLSGAEISIVLGALGVARGFSVWRRL
jgi:hypothetical protein